jgi:carboxylesterase type B
VSRDTTILQEASALASASGRHGSWAFMPVTDGIFLESTPSQAVGAGKLNGRSLLTSNAAEEGLNFVPQNISIEDELRDWIKLIFPLFTTEDAARLRSHYPSSNCTALKYATSGVSGPTALDRSATASGFQQIANSIYSE